MWGGGVGGDGGEGEGREGGGFESVWEGVRVKVCVMTRGLSVLVGGCGGGMGGGWGEG